MPSRVFGSRGPKVPHSVPRETKDLRVDVEAAFMQQQSESSGTTAQRPTSPFMGQEYFDTTLSEELVWDGTQWLGAYVTNVYVAPTTGLDGNSGTTSLLPKKTLKAVARLLAKRVARSLVTINVQENVTDATDFLQVMSPVAPEGSLDPEAVFLAAGTGPFAPIVLKVKGARTTAAFIDPNTASTSVLTMTAASTPPRALATTIDAGSNAAVLPQATINVVDTASFPATGVVEIDTTNGVEVVAYTGLTGTTLTGCTGGTGTMATGGKVAIGATAYIFVDGFDFSLWVGAQLEGMSGNILGSSAAILDAPALGIARISAWLNQATNANLASASYTATSGNTLRIYTIPTWAPHASAGIIPGCQIEFEDIEFTTATSQSIRGNTASFKGCKIRRPLLPGRGGEGGTAFIFVNCVFQFAAPAGGRSPTQLQLTTGEVRIIGGLSINIDYRVREPDAKCGFASHIMTGSDINYGGPDAGRLGPRCPVSQPFPLNNFGLGIFNWPAPDLLAPAPATTRGSTGAAVTIGHFSTISLAARVYGTCTTANTIFFRVRERSCLYISDKCTDEVAPAVPTLPTPPQDASSLMGAGTLGQFMLDEPPTTGAASPTSHPTHITPAVFRDVLAGAVAPGAGNFVVCRTWAQWRSVFARNVRGTLTGASINTIAS